MKRYLLFAGSNYYPVGGSGDFIGDFDTIIECTTKLFERQYDWDDLLDTNTGKWGSLSDFLSERKDTDL